MNFLLPFDNLRGWVRIPLKWAVFLLVVVVVCYPYPRLLARHIQHWRDPNSVLDPTEPALQPLVAELREALPADLTPADRLKRVQAFVLKHVPYAWDWDTWGMADYMPTVAEVLAAGHEDCDGRAVVAASLLRALGQEATIVTDFSHVWVRTPTGDLMGPGRADAVVATEHGLSIRLKGLLQIPHAMAYGIAVFPWPRELIIVSVAWWLMLRRRTGPAGMLVGGDFLVRALFALRLGSEDYLHPSRAVQLVGLSLLVTAVAALLWCGRSRAAREADVRRTNARTECGEPAAAVG